MAAFASLSEKLNHIFSKMTKRGRLTELEIKQAMREVRIALLEADVNINVVKQFTADGLRKGGRAGDLTNSLSPAQQVIKDRQRGTHLADGGEKRKTGGRSQAADGYHDVQGCRARARPRCAANWRCRSKKQGKKPLLVACDVYRPAAINQLQRRRGKSGRARYSNRGRAILSKSPRRAVKHARSYGFDTVIIDTAGRLQIDEALMRELEQIKKEVSPTEILLTVDAMTGQVAVEVADTFNKRLEVTGLVLTKLDGDTRGGATLSMRAVTGKPIKFCSVGEKLSDLEPFYPDRMASRILGMGDVLTLIEKAESAITEEQAKKMEKKFREMSFTFEDYLDQMEAMKKMGGLADILSMIPGMNRAKINPADLDESKMEGIKAIICSMTPRERRDPSIINSSRKIRIAKGAGKEVQDVNRLLKQFEQTKQMMKQMKNNRRFKF